MKVTKLYLIIALTGFTINMVKADCIITPTLKNFKKDITVSLPDKRWTRTTCVASETVNMCEGYCFSQATPSIIYPDFKKACKCCKASRYRERKIKLYNCDKIQFGRKFEKPSINFYEPIQCECTPCS